jgi:hypothetical protein
MNSNIDELTTMVQKVSLYQNKCSEKQPLENLLFRDAYPIEVGTKRKKSLYESDHYHDLDIDMEILSSSCSDSCDSLAISGDLEHVLSFDHDLIGECRPVMEDFLIESQKREDDPMDSSDELFVDELFDSFASEIPESDPISVTDSSLTAAVATPEKIPEKEVSSNSGPDQKLLSKLSDALSSLSKDAQESLMNRLISSINKAQSDVAAKSTEMKCIPEIKGVSKRIEDANALPIAAATLSALITQCSAAMKDRTLIKQKSLPVIPMHA